MRDMYEAGEDFGLKHECSNMRCKLKEVTGLFKRCLPVVLVITRNVCTILDDGQKRVA